MANINGKKHEEELLNALKEGIVVALHSQGKSYLKIAGIVDDSYNYVSRIVIRDIELEKRFEKKLAEQIIEAARKITDNKTYNSALKQLAENTKQEITNGQVNEQAIEIFYRKSYAETMAGLWEKLVRAQPVHIFKYQPVMVAAKTTLDGKLLVLPKEVLPTQIRETRSARRPYLVLACEQGKLELCDEEAGTLKIYVENVCKTGIRKKIRDQIPPLESLAAEQVRKICTDYLKRNNYSFARDLKEQIDERVLVQIAPIAQKKRVQLAGSALYRSSAD